MKSHRAKILLWQLAMILASICVLGTGFVQAESDGGDIVYKDTGKAAPTTFSHKEHKSAGNACADCHDGIFKKKAGAADVGDALNMKSLKEGKFCGACHNGEKAFSVKGNCKKCHPKGGD